MIDIPDPKIQFTDYKRIIREQIDAHPRSQQTQIGLSEIGHPCDLWMGYKMLGHETVNPSQGSWRPTVGTAVHTWLEACFSRYPHRFLTECVVDVGGTPGHCDLFDIDLLTVVDFKVVGATTLKKAARGDISEQYRKQMHAYGVGYLRLGHPVRRVAIMFLPSSGELDEGIFYAEDFDPHLVADAIGRLDDIRAIVEEDGAEALMKLDKAEHFCTRCDYFKPGESDPRVGCSGAGRPAANVPLTAQDLLR